jgi:hypothetical protein
MKGGAQVALAVGVGYILGRRRKMRMATALALGAATGGLGGLGPAVLKRGMKALGSTDIAGALGPQVTEIISTVRGDLLDAGKAAATTAVSSRIDSLSDSLHDRAETFRNPEAAVAEAGEAVGKAGDTVGRAASGTAGRAASGTAGRLRRRRPAQDEEYAERDEEESRNGRSRRPRRAARPESEELEPERDEAEEPADEYEEEPYEDEDEPEEPGAADEVDADEDEEPAPRRSRSSRSPVTRARR